MHPVPDRVQRGYHGIFQCLSWQRGRGPSVDSITVTPWPAMIAWSVPAPSSGPGFLVSVLAAYLRWSNSVRARLSFRRSQGWNPVGERPDPRSCGFLRAVTLLGADRGSAGVRLAPGQGRQLAVESKPRPALAAPGHSASASTACFSKPLNPWRGHRFGRRSHATAGVMIARPNDEQHRGHCSG